MQSKNDRQGNIIETQHKVFSLISRCVSIISMDISTGRPKSHAHGYIHGYQYQAWVPLFVTRVRTWIAKVYI